mgnify:FL=1
MAIGRPVSLTSSIAAKTITATATAGQTSFTVTGGYNINQIAVFRNGVRLVSGSDYTAIDGGTVTLLSAASLNDQLEFQIFDTFQASDAILKSSSSQTIDGSLTAVGGLNIGIQSAGTNVTTGVVTAFNFVGSGNTFLYDADSKTVDISISGSGGGGGLGTAINYADATTTPFSYIDYEALVKDNINFNSTEGETGFAGVNTSLVVTVNPKIVVTAGVAMTVGTGKTMVIDVLQLGDL